MRERKREREEEKEREKGGEREKGRERELKFWIITYYRKTITQGKGTSFRNIQNTGR